MILITKGENYVEEKHGKGQVQAKTKFTEAIKEIKVSQNVIQMCLMNKTGQLRVIKTNISSI